MADAWGAASRVSGTPSAGTASASGWVQEEAGAWAMGASQEVAGISREAGQLGPSSKGVEGVPVSSTAGALRSWTDPPQEWQKVASSATPAPQWMQKAIDPSPFPGLSALRLPQRPPARPEGAEPDPIQAFFRGRPDGPFPRRPGALVSGWVPRGSSCARPRSRSRPGPSVGSPRARRVRSTNCHTWGSAA